MEAAGVASEIEEEIGASKAVAITTEDPRPTMAHLQDALMDPHHPDGMKTLARRDSMTAPLQTFLPETPVVAITDPLRVIEDPLNTITVHRLATIEDRPTLAEGRLTTLEILDINA